MKALKKGFTLIELIVVIAILAILALLIVPQVTGYVDNANKAVAKANAKTCYTDYMAKKTAFDSNLTTTSPAAAAGCTVGTTSIAADKVGAYQYRVNLTTGEMTEGAAN